MAKRFIMPVESAFDSSGDPLPGAKLEFFITGTSTPQNTYSDNALSVANANPVVADSAGRFGEIFLLDADYKATLSTSADVLVWTRDPVHGSPTATTGTLSKSINYTVLSSDKGSLILVDATSGEVTISLLPSVTEFTVGVKKIDASANKVIVDGDGSETIDGGLTVELEAQYDTIFVRGDGTDWYTENIYDDFPPATASKTASYEVLVSDLNRTLLIDATTVTFAAGIQEDNSGASFTDETTDLNSATADDVALFPVGAGDNDAFYFGSSEKFCGFQMNVGTAGVGTYAVTWEYWTGAAWVALSGIVDGTSGFQTTGANDITFEVAADWATTTVNAQGPFFYVRGRRNAGTVTTDPLGTQAKIFATVLLPLAATAGNGFKISVKKIDATSNTVTTTAAGAEFIDGGSKRALSNQYDGEAYICDGTAWHTTVENVPAQPTLGTPTATTSGTEFDFTGIRATTKRISVIFEGVSLSGTDDILVQIGDAGGIETTGYISSGSDAATPATSTSGYIVRMGVATKTLSGIMMLALSDSANNTWVGSHSGKNATNAIVIGGGDKSLSDTLTQVRITRSGTDTFDAGKVNILIE